MKEIHRDQAKLLIAETILQASNCNLDILKIDFPYYDYIEEINNGIANGQISNLSKHNLDSIIPIRL